MMANGIGWVWEITVMWPVEEFRFPFVNYVSEESSAIVSVSKDKFLEWFWEREFYEVDGAAKDLASRPGLHG